MNDLQRYCSKVLQYHLMNMMQ